MNEWRINRHDNAACLFQVTLEERIPRFNFGRWDVRVASRVDMHRLVGAAKRVEQCDAIVSAANRVIPLKGETQRYRNLLSSAPKCIMIGMQVREAKHGAICVQERAKDSRPLVTPIKVSPCLVAAVKKVIPIG